MTILYIYREEDEHYSKEVSSLHDGYHYIGREFPVTHADKRISRKHARIVVHRNGAIIESVHVNPTFFKSSIDGSIQLLREHTSLTLNSGDRFALLEDQTWFKVKIVFENTERIVSSDLFSNTNGNKRCNEDNGSAIQKKIKTESLFNGSFDAYASVLNNSATLNTDKNKPEHSNIETRQIQHSDSANLENPQVQPDTIPNVTETNLETLQVQPYSEANVTEINLETPHVQLDTDLNVTESNLKTPQVQPHLDPSCKESCVQIQNNLQLETPLIQPYLEPNVTEICLETPQVQPDTVPNVTETNLETPHVQLDTDLNVTESNLETPQFHPYLEVNITEPNLETPQVQPHLDPSCKEPCVQIQNNLQTVTIETPTTTTQLRHNLETTHSEQNYLHPDKEITQCKIKEEPVESADDINLNRATFSFDQTQKGELKQEIKSEPLDNVANNADQPSSSTNNCRHLRRDRCWYGEQCYRKNVKHKEDVSHPGDKDYDSDPNDNRPVCPHGINCYRRNMQHRREYKHFGKPAPPKPINIYTCINGCAGGCKRKPNYESDCDSDPQG